MTAAMELAVIVFFLVATSWAIVNNRLSLRRKEALLIAAFCGAIDLLAYNSFDDAAVGTIFVLFVIIVEQRIITLVREFFRHDLSVDKIAAESSEACLEVPAEDQPRWKKFSENTGNGG